MLSPPIEAQPPFPEPVGRTPALAIAPVSGAPGTTVQLASAGWEANEVVSVNLEVAPDAEVVVTTVTVAVTDDDGRFTASFVFPVDPIWAEPGEVTVAAVSVETGDRATALFTVTDDAPVATPTETATTETATSVPTQALTPTTQPATATATAQPPAPTATTPPQVGNVATVTSSALNVRAGPSTAYSVLRAVSRGTRLTVLGQNQSGAWLNVRLTDGQVGWVARAYTDFVAHVPVVPAPPLPHVTPTPTTPPTYTAWRGEYFANPNLAGTPVLVRNDSAIDFDWGYGSPSSQIPVDYFSVRWTRSVHLPAGTYRFYAQADDGVRVWVNGELLINEWRPATGRTYSVDKYLDAGTHHFRVEYYEATQIAKIRFWWDTVTHFPEWRGEYFSNPHLLGTPTLVRNDNAIDFDWGRGAPAPGVPADRFSVRWTRDVHLSAGTYRFRATMDDGMRVYLDGNLIINEWRDGSAREVIHDVYLGTGTYHIVVEFYENRDFALARFRWDRLSTPEPDHFPDWRGEYFDNRHLEGSPVVVRNDRHIDFNWGTGSPDPRIPNDNFSARWTRHVHFEAGTYRFHARSDDGVRVFVDGNRIINEWRDMSAGTVHTADIYLDGRKEVKVEYYERTGGARITVWWDRVTTTPTPTPTATPTRPAENPYADVSPAGGTAGTSVTVSGGNFPANTRVNVYLGSTARAAAQAAAPQVYATVVTDRNGLYSTSFVMPGNWPDGAAIQPGRLVVLVATEGFSVEATGSFDFRADPPPVEPNPSARVSPQSGGAGTQVTVSGGGFPANTDVAVYLAGLVEARAAAPNQYATMRTDAAGNYSVTFAMPARWPSGEAIESGKVMLVVATAGFTSQASVDFDFFVQAPDPSIRLSPTSGGPGTSVAVSGGGFPANVQVNIYLGTLDAQPGQGVHSQVYGNTVSDRNGNYSTSITIPAQWSDGGQIVSDRLVVLAANIDFSYQVGATFNFTPAGPTATATPVPPPTNTPVAPPPPALNPFVGVNPTTAGPGTPLTVSGGAFPGNTTVNVHLARFDMGGASAAGSERYATVSTDANGVYSMGFAMPDRWPDGELIANGPILVVVATNDFSVLASFVLDYVAASPAGVWETQPEPTATPVPPEPTATPQPEPEPTATPVPAEPTATNTPQPEPEPTATPVPAEPTATPQPEPEPTQPPAEEGDSASDAGESENGGGENGGGENGGDENGEETENGG